MSGVFEKRSLLVMPVFAHVVPVVGGEEHNGVFREAGPVKRVQDMAELGVRGLPAVLVPFPAAAEDHQTRNAEAVVRLGGALRIAEEALDVRAVASVVDLLLDDARRSRMGRGMAGFGRPDAADAIARAILDRLAAR